LDLDGRADRGGLPGHPFDQRVGHDLAPRPRIALGSQLLGVARQLGVSSDSLGNRQERSEPRHGVRCRAQRHPAVADCAPGAGQIGVRIEPVGDPAGPGLDLAVTEPTELTGQLGVGPPSILLGQAGGLTYDKRGPPLADLAGSQRGQGGGHLVHERLRQTQQPRAPVRRLTASQGDLCPDAPADLLGRHPFRALVLAL
jgi:hypothetical protein